MSHEELYERGPDSKDLLNNMRTSLEHNLKITESQYAAARRGLIEEQMKFKNFNNYNKKESVVN